MTESDPALDATLGADAGTPVGTLRVGATVGGRYRILGFLGAGGMGAVYLAHDEMLGAEVALKLVGPGVAATAGGLRRLRDEVLLAQQVTSPHVCRTYDLEEVEGLWLVKMEYIAGETLAERIGRGRLEIAEGVEVARQIVEGLAAAHRKGVVHRDLKPHNVMIEQGTRRAVLMDFGLARRVAPGEAAEEVSGTPSYMSPEQVRGLEVDPRSDLYSLGCLLWHALVGEVVFAESTAAEAMRRQVEDRPPDPRTRRPELPAWLARTLLALLEKDPARRPADAATVLGLLRAPRPLWWRVGAPAVAVLGVVAGLAWSGAFTPAWKPEITPHLPTHEENADGAAISPDGQWIAFTSDRERTNVFRLYVAPLAGGRARALTPPERSVAPYTGWARDSSAVLFTSFPREMVAYRLSLAGGAPEPIASRLMTIDDCNGRYVGVDPGPPDCPTCQRIVVIAGDGEPREVHRFGSGDWIYNPRCDATGERVVFGLAEQQQEFAIHPESDVWLLHLDGGEPRRLTDDRASFDPVFHPDGLSVVFARTREHRTNLWEMPLDGGAPVQLTFGEGHQVRPAIAPDGQVLLYNLDETSTPLFAHKGGQRRKISSSKADLQHLRLTPDGREVVAEAASDGGDRIVAFAVDSGEDRVIAEGTDPAITLDGAEVVYVAGSTILAVPRAGGAPRTIAEIDGKVAALEVGGDDRIHFGLTRGGTREAWRVPLAGGAPEREAPAPWCQVVPAPAGGWTYALRCASTVMREVHLFAPGAGLDDAPARTLWASKVAWEASGASLVAYDLEVVRRVEVASGATTELLELPIATSVALAPDGTIYSAEIVSHVTRHLITNFGDRPRP